MGDHQGSPGCCTEAENGEKHLALKTLQHDTTLCVKKPSALVRERRKELPDVFSASGSNMAYQGLSSGCPPSTHHHAWVVGLAALLCHTVYTGLMAQLNWLCL
ncbi:UNVERIFIED_CONTAM: hypothetical protein K2H54_032444 [Gekko kuhli]